MMTKNELHQHTTNLHRVLMRLESAQRRGLSEPRSSLTIKTFYFLAMCAVQHEPPVQQLA